MRDLFVIAGNHKQFMNLCHQAAKPWDFELKNKMVHYVSEPQVLDGVHDARVFLYGTYFQRPDWGTIEQVIVMNKLRTLLIR